MKASAAVAALVALALVCAVDAQASKGLIGWLSNGRPLVDATSEFTSIAKTPVADGALKAIGANYVYVLVPGLLTKHYPGYFDATEKSLKASGLTVVRAAIDTDQSTEVNGKALADFLKKENAKQNKRQFVILAHSKGCNDLGAAFGFSPDIVPMVRGVVMIQGAFGGSPVGTDMAAHPHLFAIIGMALKLIRADAKSISDLSYGARQAFLAKYPYPKALLASTLCLRTSFTRKTSALFPIMEHIKKQYNVGSDGLVALPDAFVPGARTVTIDNMDHGDTIFELPGISAAYKPGQLARAALMQLLRSGASTNSASAVPSAPAPSVPSAPSRAAASAAQPGSGKLKGAASVRHAVNKILHSRRMLSPRF